MCYNLAASHSSLDAVYPLLKEEMQIKLSQAHAAHRWQEGRVLRIIWNNILDHIVKYGIGVALLLFGWFLLQ